MNRRRKLLLPQSNLIQQSQRDLKLKMKRLLLSFKILMIYKARLRLLRVPPLKLISSKSVALLLQLRLQRNRLGRVLDLLRVRALRRLKTRRKKKRRMETKRERPQRRKTTRKKNEKQFCELAILLLLFKKINEL